MHLDFVEIFWELEVHIDIVGLFLGANILVRLVVLGGVLAGLLGDLLLDLLNNLLLHSLIVHLLMLLLSTWMSLLEKLASLLLMVKAAILLTLLPLLLLFLPLEMHIPHVLLGFLKQFFLLLPFPSFMLLLLLPHFLLEIFVVKLPADSAGLFENASDVRLIVVLDWALEADDVSKDWRDHLYVLLCELLGVFLVVFLTYATPGTVLELVIREGELVVEFTSHLNAFLDILWFYLSFNFAALGGHNLRGLLKHRDSLPISHWILSPPHILLEINLLKVLFYWSLLFSLLSLLLRSP